MAKSLVFIIYGKSCTGKDSIMNKFRESIDNNKQADYNLKILTPYTTRPIRENEVDGKEYNFVSNEYVEINKNFLFDKKDYNVITKDGKPDIWTYFFDKSKFEYGSNYIITGTIETIKNFNIMTYTNDIKIIPIYLYLDESIRIKRAIKRELETTNNFKEMIRRIESDDKDFKENNINFDSTFKNVDLDYTFLDIEYFIHKEIIKNRKGDM